MTKEATTLSREAEDKKNMDESMEVDEMSDTKDADAAVETAKKGTSDKSDRKLADLAEKQETDEEEAEDAAESMELEEGNNASPGDGGGVAASCTSDPNFAVICSFMEKFGVSCGIPCPGIGELQELVPTAARIGLSKDRVKGNDSHSFFILYTPDPPPLFSYPDTVGPFRHEELLVLNEYCKKFQGI
jgi:hypothetical protein